MKIIHYNTETEALTALTEELLREIKLKRTAPFHLALPGGETIRQLFDLWTKSYRDIIPWNDLRFYWVDETCVDPENDESNFKHANQQLFIPLDIPTTHIYRIFGEQDPVVESERYSDMVKWELPGYSKLPRFDAIILGTGADGHVASIFPAYSRFLSDNRAYVVSDHPITKQKQITMTGMLILNAKSILIPITGAEKQEIITRIKEKRGNSPIQHILARAKEATIFTDNK